MILYHCHLRITVLVLACRVFSLASCHTVAPPWCRLLGRLLTWCDLFVSHFTEIRFFSGVGCGRCCRLSIYLSGLHEVEVNMPFIWLWTWTTQYTFYDTGIYFATCGPTTNYPLTTYQGTEQTQKCRGNVKYQCGGCGVLSYREGDEDVILISR